MAGYNVADEGLAEITVRNATASWIQPRAIPRGYHDAYSAAFLGFAADDEYNDPQIATEANTIGGTTQYFASYTTCVPSSTCQPVRLRESVRPGDHIRASISYKGTRFTLKIADVRYRNHHAPQHWTRTIRFNDSEARLGGMSVGVSWLVDTGNFVQPLAKFSAVHFAHVDVNGYVIGSQFPDNGYQFTLEGGAGALATSSALNRAGDGFVVIWKRTGP